jgi:hypothetical protein
MVKIVPILFQNEQIITLTAFAQSHNPTQKDRPTAVNPTKSMF